MGWKNIMKNFIVVLTYYECFRNEEVINKHAIYFVRAKGHGEAQMKAREYFYKHRYNVLVHPHRIDSHYIPKNIKVDWLGDFI